jgi:hypothetical protein
MNVGQLQLSSGNSAPNLGNNSHLTIPCSSFSQKYPGTEVQIRTTIETSLLTRYKQFGMNSIIMLMFVESRGVHISAADLLKQKSQKEVLKSKPSTASSDEKNWLQASQQLDCRPRGSLERRGKSS